MLKDVDFASIVWKLAFLLLLINSVEISSYRMMGVFKTATGWISVAFFLLLLLAFCFFAARTKEETAETRTVTLFAFRVFGLFRIIRILVVLPSLFQLLETKVPASIPPAILVWQGVFLLIGLSLLFLPCRWNRLILAVGRFLRRY